MTMQKEYIQITNPIPHALIETKKKLHGWYVCKQTGRRECTAERMLINPYNGCGVNCFYCYARALPGYFEVFHNEGTIFVSENFDKVVAKQLDSIDIASCGYLSPVTDPFQKINEKYRLSEKIINVFTSRNIPIEFITKCRIPDEVIDSIKKQKHSFGQVSILTTDERLRKILAPGGTTTGELFNNLNRLAENNIFAVCRIDPIFPFVTDNKERLAELVQKAIDSGAKHIIASVVDIPVKISTWFLDNIKKHFGNSIYFEYKQLYTEKIGYMNAKTDYRKRLFDFLRNTCDKKGITFALCMEYNHSSSPLGGEATRSGSGEGGCIDLNKTFMSSTNCEGIDIPIYKRKGDKFYPATDCAGNCLNCTDAKCGVDALAMGKPNSKKDFKLKDYRKWSKNIEKCLIQV